ncbi:MAG: hypothetical protein H0V72_14675 [Bradyrhizobium sp.]|nr:hypothetical protein [Bradyrhizobium sp.]MBA3726783.1 hypothetical protein [Armatimonadota bacterium]
MRLVFDIGTDAFTSNLAADQKRNKRNRSQRAASYENPEAATWGRSVFLLFCHFFCIYLRAGRGAPRIRREVKGVIASLLWF